MANELHVRVAPGALNAGFAGDVDLDCDRDAFPEPPLRMTMWHWLFAALSASVALGLVVVRLGRDDQFITYLWFAFVGPLLAVIDLATRRLPDWLTLPSYPVILALLVFAAGVLHANASLTRAVVASAMMLATFGLLCVLTDTGYGDLKLAGLLGLVLGSHSWQCLFSGSVYGWLLAGAWATCRIFAGRSDGRLPLGPPLIVGAFVALLW